MPQKNVVVDLPYGSQSLRLSIPESNLLAVVSPADIAPTADPAATVRNALRQPVGSPPLTKLVRNGQKILILIDDKTRSTPHKVVLPILLQEIEAAAPDASVTFLIANGTHIPMTPEEIRTHVGDDIAGRYPFVNHDWRDTASMVDMGRTANGTPIVVNRMLGEADLVLAVGSVVPHPLAGWGGGAKMVQPGVCGRETTNATHELETISAQPHLGNINNPMRLEIEAVVKRVPLHFMVNCIFERHTQLVDVVAGEPVASHRAAVEKAKPIWAVPIPGLADIVVVSSYPSDIDFWQSGKALGAAELAVKRGGDILVVSPCPESFCAMPEHVETQTRLAGLPSKLIRREAVRLGITDGGGVNAASDLARVREFAFVQIYSPGITESDMGILGYERAMSVEEGLRRAFERQGPCATVTVITHGGDTYPALRV